jgi:hypothetical protein
MQHSRTALRFILCAALLTGFVAVAGCSDDSGGGGSDCGANEEYNPILDTCEPQIRGGDDTGTADAGDDATADGSSEDAANDTGGDDTGSTDAGDDASGDSGSDAVDDDSGVGDDTGNCPDRDGDGFADEACGGQDCNDNNPSMNPGLSEICDTLDNDCSGEVNDGRSCTFYAQTSSELFLVDPFEKTATTVTSVPGLFDMDTHPNGTLYGITSSALFEFDEVNDQWNQVGSLGTPVTTTPNGLAIDTQGTAYMTASNNVYTVDLATGSSNLIGSMGGSYNSSGDCVINKDDTLFMSSDHGFSGTDSLILIDTTDGSGSQIGQTGFSEIYGLTAAWGRMYGLTGAGELIEIDSGSGQATLVHTFSGKSWYGAASTPNR